ncbi:DUF6428 family protein [Flagellimonas sp. DF-77]|uniref:DUF6428 family protein n=1 Tax=Flagellimonas algarum TaxID=3230298 RepID=UPI00339436F3
MQTHEFLSLLNEHKNKALLFEYLPGLFVGANYHITEVKNVTIDSVDCGAGTDFWKETVIQLWESPQEQDKTEFMKAFKALGILNKVDRIKPLVQDTEVKFEYSNAGFHTAQLFVNDYVYNDDKIIIKLVAKKTDCKAKETCGVPEPAVVGAESSCAPGSGCC